MLIPLINSGAVFASSCSSNDISTVNTDFNNDLEHSLKVIVNFFKVHCEFIS